MLTVTKLYTKGIAAQGGHYNQAKHSVRVITATNRVYDLKLVDLGICEYPDPTKHRILWLHGYEEAPEHQRLSELEISTVPVGRAGYASGVGIVINMKQEAIPEITSDRMASMYVESGITDDPSNMTWIHGQVENGKVLTGIGISRDGSTIILRSKGGEIVLGEDGALIGGNQVVLATESERNSAITNHNPLSFLPPTFFIPLPENLPDLQTIDKMASIGTAVGALLSV